ncbi:hypothetical protein B0T16DRAFT_497633 [Cercophora newfieldiana]|uniref:Uncharacterized protein n=1 Tax=Cercophora newfieldiana TaxID=92897 RepID=A0AA39XUB1_9PEZI|nr:hypothetical protein B0T16DRAFT_497633 [Cercophora newfieldiana]
MAKKQKKSRPASFNFGVTNKEDEDEDAWFEKSPFSSTEMISIQFDAGHVLVQYLYTAGYNTLRWVGPDGNENETIAQFKTSFEVYAIAREYELDKLEDLAKEQILEFSKTIDAMTVIDIATDAYPTSIGTDTWFPSFINTIIRTAFEKALTAQAIPGDDSATNVPPIDKAPPETHDVASVVFRGALELYLEKIKELAAKNEADAGITKCDCLVPVPPKTETTESVRDDHPNQPNNCDEKLAKGVDMSPSEKCDDTDWWSLPASKTGEHPKVEAEPTVKPDDEVPAVIELDVKPECDELVEEKQFATPSKKEKKFKVKKKKAGIVHNANDVEPSPEAVLCIDTMVESPVEETKVLEDETETDPWRFWGAKKSPRPSM